MPVRVGNTKGNRHGSAKDLDMPYEFDEYQIMFIEIYCNTFNAGQSALQAGYAKKEYAYELLNNPHIAQAIYERLRVEKMGAPEVLNRVQKIVRADLKHFMKIKRTWEKKEVTNEKTGEVTIQKVMHKEVVVDLVNALQNDETYALKAIEYYRSGEVKKITLEDRLEAIRLMGSAFGLFGLKTAGDDEGRSWMERARDKGYELRTVIDSMIEIAKEYKMELPKELIEGSFRETQNPETGKTEIEIGDLSEEEEIDAPTS